MVRLAPLIHALLSTFCGVPSVASEGVDDDALQIRRYLPQFRSYIDVEDLDTAVALDAVKRLPVRRFRLPSDSERQRIGILGPDLSSALPTAVDFTEGENLIQNNDAVFYHSVGAVQELSKQLSELVDANRLVKRRIAELSADWLQLERATSTSLNNSTELALRRTAADAAIAKNNMEMELLRSRSEKEYAQVQEKLEAEQLAKSERMAIDRLKREDEASKRRTAELIRAKFEASQRIAAHRSNVSTALAASCQL